MNSPGDLTSNTHADEIPRHLIALKYDVCELNQDCQPCRGIREKSIEIIERLQRDLTAAYERVDTLTLELENTNANLVKAIRRTAVPPPACEHGVQRYVIHECGECRREIQRQAVTKSATREWAEKAVLKLRPGKELPDETGDGQ